jgi:hypothetical protein
MRDALWWKLGQKEVSKLIEGVKEMYRNVNITVKFEDNWVLRNLIQILD